MGSLVRIFLSILLLILLVPGYSGEAPLRRPSGTPSLRATPVALFPLAPHERQLGPLTYLGGLRLASGDPAFGGFSALAVEGDRFTLLSDGGNILRFRLGTDWQPRGARFESLPEGPGTGWSKEDRDSESMTVDPETGRIWIGFERANAIWRYAPGFARAERRARPREMSDWSLNRGAEAMARLADGSFLVFAEDVVESDASLHPALWFRSDPTEPPRRGFAFRFRAPPGYRPVAAAELPSGDLLVLTRAVSIARGFTAKLVVVPRAAIRSGATVTGRTLATFAPPALHDNFEALAVTREGGATILWIASDDNESLFQQTLLLKFRLDANAAPER